MRTVVKDAILTCSEPTNSALHGASAHQSGLTEPSMRLTQALRRLTPTGPDGFEGLIHRLVERLTGYSLYLARAGDQSGRDMRSGGAAASTNAVECKRYGKSREFAQTELVGKLAEAKYSLS